ncbi:hypothetical protein [Nocardia vaccinii]|nr:hypothetical protein [Nocardia vaccinii]
MSTAPLRGVPGGDGVVAVDTPTRIARGCRHRVGVTLPGGGMTAW